MKVQVDITVEDRAEAVMALDFIAGAIEFNGNREDVYVGDQLVGRFEILEAQEQAA